MGIRTRGKEIPCETVISVDARKTGRFCGADEQSSSKTERTDFGKQHFTVLKQVTMQESAIDGTRKYLFELEDHNMVESVLMRYKHGNSVCISSQVGCRMGCRFCASTFRWTGA